MTSPPKSSKVRRYKGYTIRNTGLSYFAFRPGNKAVAATLNTDSDLYAQSLAEVKRLINVDLAPIGHVKAHYSGSSARLIFITGFGRRGYYRGVILASPPVVTEVHVSCLKDTAQSRGVDSEIQGKATELAKRVGKGTMSPTSLLYSLGMGVV